MTWLHPLVGAFATAAAVLGALCAIVAHWPPGAPPPTPGPGGHVAHGRRVGQTGGRFW